MLLGDKNALYIVALRNEKGSYNVEIKHSQTG